MLVSGRLLYCFGLTALLQMPFGAAAAPQGKLVSRIDLSKPFGLPPGAAFTASQGPDAPNPFYDAVYDPDDVPGPISLCVRMSSTAQCAPDLSDALVIHGNEDFFSEPHFLDLARLVYPRGSGGSPLLHLQISSLHSGDGDQVRAAEILAYRPLSHRFETIFHEQFGRNNNEEVRYIQTGPLKGAIISVDQTDKPFGYWGYWVTVHRLTDDYRYKQVLRYRTATRYGDGNPLAVIDSEMPNILRRIGLWRPGQPLPLPKSGCAKPRLVKSELWCS